MESGLLEIIKLAPSRELGHSQLDFNGEFGFLVALLLMMQLDVGGICMLEPVCSSHSVVTCIPAGSTPYMLVR